MPFFGKKLGFLESFLEHRDTETQRKQGFSCKIREVFYGTQRHEDTKFLCSLMRSPSFLRFFVFSIRKIREIRVNPCKSDALLRVDHGLLAEALPDVHPLAAHNQVFQCIGQVS